MQFLTLLTLTAAVATTGVVAAPTKSAANTLPTSASIWLETPSGDTEAFLTDAGQVWQWADESGSGPAAAKFDIALVPGSLQPSGADALVRFTLAGKTCRIVADFFDCTDADTSAPVATFRAKVQTDAVGETHWALLGGYAAFSTQTVKDELHKLSPKPTYSSPYNAYLRTDA